VTFVEDVDAVRDYARREGRDDYVRLYESGERRVAVEFSDNLQHHAQAIAALIQDQTHVHVLAGPLPEWRREELSEQYWESRRDAVLAAWGDHEIIRQLSFGYDDDGPVLRVGLVPRTPATIAEAAELFAPHRIVTFEGPEALAL
jgi:hypothetical protein